MRPRTSLGETPALRQSIGMIALLMYVLATGWARQGNRRSGASPVLRAVMGGCAGRTVSHASMAWPSKGWINRLGERGACLVDGDVKQADRRCVGTGDIARLPTDAADAQAHDLVAALAGEQPGQRQRADEFEGIGADTTDGEVIGPEIEPGPQDLGPGVVGDDPRLGAEHPAHAARGSERGRGIEAPNAPAPFLAVAQERPGRADVTGHRRGREPPPDAANEVDPALCVVADAGPRDPRDPGRTGLTRPVRRCRDSRLLGRQPSPDLGQDTAVFAPNLGRQRRGGEPTIDPDHPFRGCALHRHLAASGGYSWRMGETQPSDRAVDGMELPVAPAQARVAAQMLLGIPTKPAAGTDLKPAAVPT